MERREEMEGGFGVVLSEDFPGVVIDNQKRFTREGIRYCCLTEMKKVIVKLTDCYDDESNWYYL